MENYNTSPFVKKPELTASDIMGVLNQHLAEEEKYEKRNGCSFRGELIRKLINEIQKLKAWHTLVLIVVVNATVMVISMM